MAAGFQTKAMRSAFLAFALPALLALSPVRAPAASILWVSVDPDVPVNSLKGDLIESALRNFRLDGRGVNAAKVSVSDGVGGSTSYLVIAYEDPSSGRLVADDSSCVAAEISFSGSGSEGVGGSGGAGDTESGGGWIPVCLGDLSNPNLTVTLELGYIEDWDAYDAYVANNEGNPGALLSGDDGFFHELAYATATLGELMDAPHVSTQSDLSTPSASPWSPREFTAVPEPSVCLTALLGILLLSRHRRPRRAAR